MHALKIESVRHGHDKDGERKIGTCVLYPEDKTFLPIEVDADWCCEKIKFDNPDQPDDCGYYIAYADGYRSWSPSKAFEEGYTRL